MLLHSTQHGGEAGARELRHRIAVFDRGDWHVLLTAAKHQLDRENRKREARKQRRGQQTKSVEETTTKAQSLIGMGELSHAAGLLTSPGVAPGSDATLDQLQNRDLRPENPVIPIPDAVSGVNSPGPGFLDWDIFAKVLRTSRKGLSAGMWGARYEY